MKVYVALGLELAALAFIPMVCFGAIFLRDSDVLLSRETWAWYAPNVAFLLVPKALWWAIGRIVMSRAARLGGLLGADTLAVALTLLALTLPGEAGWLWYVLLVVPGMVVGAGLASSALAMVPQQDGGMRSPSRASAAMLFGCALMLVTLLVLAASPRPWRRISFPVDLKVAESRSRQFNVPGRTTYRLEFVAERRLPFEELECLLGYYSETLSGHCPTGGSPLDLAWSIQYGGQTVAGPASGDLVGVGGSSTANTLSRYLGRGTISAGRGYRVLVSSRKDASVLNTTNPTVVAEAIAWSVRPTTLVLDALAVVGFGLWAFGLIRIDRKAS